jgi:hypothetical protein
MDAGECVESQEPPDRDNRTEHADAHAGHDRNTSQRPTPRIHGTGSRAGIDSHCDCEDCPMRDNPRQVPQSCGEATERSAIERDERHLNCNAASRGEPGSSPKKENSMTLSRLLDGSCLTSKARLGAGALIAAMAMSSVACNRANRDDGTDVGRGPGDETAHSRDTDPSVAQPGAATPDPATEQNPMAAPGMAPMDQDRQGRTNTSEPQLEPGMQRDSDTLAGTGGGSGGKSNSGRPGGSTGGTRATGGSTGKSTRTNTQGTSDVR